NWDPESYGGGRYFGHLAYAVENIYATCQRLRDHGVGHVPDGGPAPVALPVPVVGELHLGRRVPWRRHAQPPVASRSAGPARQLLQPERVAVEPEGCVDIGDAHHGVQVLHVSLGWAGGKPVSRAAAVNRRHTYSSIFRTSPRGPAP